MGGDIIELDDSNFTSVVTESAAPVLVDFSAEWCGPCKKLEPIVRELARQFEGRLRVAHMDVEGSPMTAARFGVMSVPTLIFFRGGVPAQQLNGLVSRQVLEQTIQKVIA